MLVEIVQIHDDDRLRRRVPEIAIDPNDPSGKIQSIFFRTEDQSADLCRLRTRRESQSDDPGCGLVEFGAADARFVGLDPVHDPCPKDAPHNYAHVLCRGKLTSKKAKALRDRSDYCVRVGEIAT